MDLYKQSQSQQDPSWALSHLAGHALGTAGYAMGGFPGSMAGEALGVLGVKPMIKKMFKGARQNSVVKGIQAALSADDRSAAYGSAARSSSRRYDQEPHAGQCVLNYLLAVFTFHFPLCSGVVDKFPIGPARRLGWARLVERVPNVFKSPACWFLWIKQHSDQHRYREPKQ